LKKKKRSSPFAVQLRKLYPNIGTAKDTIRKFISVHIPRTGGTTFRNLLFYWFGVLNVYHDETNKNYIPELKIGEIPDNIHMFDVIHGHFPYAKYQYMELPTITWIRNPVDIIISQFYALRKHNTGPKSPPVHLPIIRREMSLLEFAEYEGSYNAISKFIGGVSLDKFAFVGLTEHYQHSLERLREWSRLPVPNAYPIYNQQGYKECCDKDRAVIASFNKEDMKIYNEATRRFAP
jgi:hypothetical protein